MTQPASRQGQVNLTPLDIRCIIGYSAASERNIEVTTTHQIICTTHPGGDCSIDDSDCFFDTAD